MDLVTFYGSTFGRETSSSDENDDDQEECYLPSQEEMEDHESGLDESEEDVEVPPSIANNNLF